MRNVVIEEWHGFKLTDGTAEVVVLGYGFGEITGSVKLNVRGGGVIRATVKRWSDNAIVIAAPVDVIIQRVHVYSLDSRGREKQSAQSPAGETRDTNGTAPTWAVTGLDDSVDYITVEGTDLDQVVDVTLYDSSIPVKLFNATFLLEDGDLKIDWPAAFTAPIKKLRLSDANGNRVGELDAGPSGLTPDPNGVILDTSVQQNGQYAVLNLIGSGLGFEDGSVKLAKSNGPLLSVPVLSNGWSDSVVQVIVDSGSSYEAIELTRADGEIATVDAGVEFPITITPVQEVSISYDPVTDVLTYTSVSGVFAEGPLSAGNVDRITYRTAESGNALSLSSNEIEFVSAYELRVANADMLTIGTTLTEAVFINSLGNVRATWVGSLGPIVSQVTFNVTVDDVTNRILVEASRDFFNVGANPPYAIELTVDGQLYTMSVGTGYSYWTVDDSTHAYIQDASAWGNVVTDIDFFSTGYALVFLAGWDGSVNTQ